MTTNRKRMAAVAAAVAMAAAWGCRDGSAADAGAWYRIDAAAVTVAPGASGVAQVKFVPREGYHWNPEFPAKLKVSDLGTVRAERTDFSLSNGDFRDQGGTGVLSIPVAAQAAGTTALKAVADFSVCNDKECRIFKQVAVEVPIHVQ